MKKTEQLFKPDHLHIPYQLVDDRRLEPADRMLYGLIYWYEHMKDGECFASNQAFANLLYTTTRAVQNSLNQLEKCGFIARDYKDDAKRNRLRIRALIAEKYVRTGGDRQKTSEAVVIDERTHGDRHERSGGDQNENTGNKNTHKDIPARSAEQEKDISEVIYAFREVNPAYEKLYARKPQRQAAAWLLENRSKEQVLKIIAFLKISNAATYAPTITTPQQLEAKMGELISWSEKQKNRGAASGKGKPIIGLTKTS